MMMNNLKKIKEYAKNFSVLYVEDDLAIQESTQKYLQKLFAKVVVANDGYEGIHKYKTQEFDLVITDLSMPKMNGIEMIEQIRALDEDKNILITTAHGETEYILSAIRSGVDGYVIKPIDYSQLNYELYKIVNKLQKFYEGRMYKRHLENLIDKKSALVSSLLRMQSENYEKTIFSMVEMIEDRDTYTAGHSKRVAKYSKMIAENMGYSEEDCTKIYQASILHDIGKIATPDAVLLNPKQLNDIEYKLIQEHVNVGYKLLYNVPMFSSLAEIVYSHHERYDGEGYPRGLKAQEITPFSRIIILADAFDAMTTSRIYKAKKDVNEAIDELKLLSKKQFHPEVVTAACEVLKDIVLDDNIQQLPRTDLEEERFAYFYKDILTNTYNKNYLDLVLMRNAYDRQYLYMYAIYLKDFSFYNKLHSWKMGDDVLKDFATLLKENFSKSLIFRVFGDDFIVLCEEQLYFGEILLEIDEILSKTEINYEIKEYNLSKSNMKSGDDIDIVSNFEFIKRYK
jgi:putative nucleotidyltransferase with HDIG domain